MHGTSALPTPEDDLEAEEFARIEAEERAKAEEEVFREAGVEGAARTRKSQTHRSQQPKQGQNKWQQQPGLIRPP